jgi:hypothetical protein
VLILLFIVGLYVAAEVIVHFRTDLLLIVLLLSMLLLLVSLVANVNILTMNSGLLLVLNLIIRDIILIMVHSV